MQPRTHWQQATDTCTDTNTHTHKTFGIGHNLDLILPVHYTKRQMACFRSIFKPCRPVGVYSFIDFDSSLLSLVEGGAALIFVFFFGEGSLQLQKYTYATSAHWYLIILVKYGPAPVQLILLKPSRVEREERDYSLVYPHWTLPSCRAIVQWEDDWHEDERWGGDRFHWFWSQPTAPSYLQTRWRTCRTIHTKYNL